MNLIRRSIALLTLAVLTLTLVGAAPSAPEGHGTAETRLQLLALGVSGLPTDDLDAAVGTLIADAGTVEAPSAGLRLEGLRAGGTTLADWEADSGDGTDRGSHGIDLDAAGITGSVSIVDYLAEADEEALARIAALTGDIDAGPLGLAAQLGERGLSSRVTTTGATGITEVSIDGLSLHVGDLLPTDLLDGLPLGVLVDVLDQLPVDLDPELADAVDRLEELLADLETIVDLDAQRRTVFSELRALLADHPEVIDAEATLADAEATLDDARSALRDAEADVDVATTELAAAEQTLADVQAELADAEQTVADLEADRAALQAELNDLEDDLAFLRSLDGTLTGLLTGLQTLESEYGDEAGCATLTSLLTLTELSSIADCYEAYLLARIDTVESELAGVTDDLATATTLRDTLRAAEADALAAVAVVEDTLSEALAEVARIEQVVADARDAVTEAVAALERVIEEAATDPETLALLEEFEELTTQLRSLLDELSGQLAGLPDLAALRDELAGVLGDAPLFDLGRLAIDVEVHAHAEGATSAVSCTVSDVAVIGRSPLAELDCAELTDALDHVEEVLAGLLGALPVTLPVEVELAGLRVDTDTAEDTDAGAASATASVSALRAAIGSVELDGIVDETTDRLGDLVDETLTIVDGLGDLAAGDLPLLANGATASAISALPGELDALAGTVASLPLGDGLDGLRTVGIDLTVAGIDAEGAFLAAERPVDADDAGDVGDDPEGAQDPQSEQDPDAGKDPSDGGTVEISGPGDDDAGPAPGAPGSDPGAPGSGDPELPRTGAGGLLPLLGAALVLAGARLRSGSPER